MLQIEDKIEWQSLEMAGKLIKNIYISLTIMTPLQSGHTKISLKFNEEITNQILPSALLKFFPNFRKINTDVPSQQTSA